MKQINFNPHREDYKLTTTMNNINNININIKLDNNNKLKINSEKNRFADFNSVIYENEKDITDDEQVVPNLDKQKLNQLFFGGDGKENAFPFGLSSITEKTERTYFSDDSFI